MRFNFSNFLLFRRLSTILCLDYFILCFNRLKDNRQTKCLRGTIVPTFKTQYFQVFENKITFPTKNPNISEFEIVLNSLYHLFSTLHPIYIIPFHYLYLISPIDVFPDVSDSLCTQILHPKYAVLSNLPVLTHS